MEAALPAGSGGPHLTGQGGQLRQGRGHPPPGGGLQPRASLRRPACSNWCLRARGTSRNIHYAQTRRAMQTTGWRAPGLRRTASGNRVPTPATDPRPPPPRPGLQGVCLSSCSTPYKLVGSQHIQGGGQGRRIKPQRNRCLGDTPRVQYGGSPLGTVGDILARLEASKIFSAPL